MEDTAPTPTSLCTDGVILLDMKKKEENWSLMPSPRVHLNFIAKLNFANGITAGIIRPWIYVAFFFCSNLFSHLGFHDSSAGKEPLAIRDTWVQSLSWEDPLEKGKVIHSSILAWKISWTVYTPWDRKESDTTE